jgi:hypothetical protein
LYTYTKLGSFGFLVGNRLEMYFPTLKTESGFQSFSISKPIRHLRDSLNLGIDPFTYGIGDRMNKLRHNTVQMSLCQFGGMVPRLHRRSVLRTSPPQLFLMGCSQVDLLILQFQLHTLYRLRVFEAHKVQIQFSVTYGSALSCIGSIIYYLLLI